jgi:crotonobetainyl-CoA:carnitine CoA-transferase CaiB-like acyl-CoA transferase
LRAGTSINDIMGGMFAVIGILAALEERRRTGKGQKVCSALFENNVFLVAQHMMQFAVTGKPAAPMPARTAAWAVYDVFDTADGQLFVGVVTDSQWRAFCAAFGLADLAADAGLATNPLRVAAGDRFMPRLREVFAKRSNAELVQICEQAGLPFALITKPEDLFDDPHLATPGAMVEITLPSGKRTPAPALPLEMAGRRPGLRRDLPKVGEHGKEVAADLGYGPSEIAELVENGVLGA